MIPAKFPPNELTTPKGFFSIRFVACFGNHDLTPHSFREESEEEIIGRKTPRLSETSTVADTNNSQTTQIRQPLETTMPK